jgi:hypothetical protein
MCSLDKIHLKIYSFISTHTIQKNSSFFSSTALNNKLKNSLFFKLFKFSDWKNLKELSIIEN